MDTEATEAEAKSESRFPAKVPWKARQSGSHKSRAENAKHEPEGKSGSKARGIFFIGPKAAGGSSKTALSNGPCEYFRQSNGYLRPRHGLGIGAYRRCRVPSRAVA